MKYIDYRHASRLEGYVRRIDSALIDTRWEWVLSVLYFTRIPRIIYWCSSPMGWRGAICRWRNHPAGVKWVNTSGLEPDMRCRNCGEDLG